MATDVSKLQALLVWYATRWVELSEARQPKWRKATKSELIAANRRRAILHEQAQQLRGTA